MPLMAHFFLWDFLVLLACLLLHMTLETAYQVPVQKPIGIFIGIIHSIFIKFREESFLWCWFFLFKDFLCLPIFQDFCVLRECFWVFLLSFAHFLLTLNLDILYFCYKWDFLVHCIFKLCCGFLIFKNLFTHIIFIFLTLILIAQGSSWKLSNAFTIFLPYNEISWNLM